MFIGMLVLGAPAGLVVDYDDSAQMLGSMGVTMTLPMAAWMRYRGHDWRPIAEMSAAMLIPVGDALALLLTDTWTDVGALLAVEHVAMLAAMLGAMLLRPDEYTHHHHAVAA